MSRLECVARVRIGLLMGSCIFRVLKVQLHPFENELLILLLIVGAL